MSLSSVYCTRHRNRKGRGRCQYSSVRERHIRKSSGEVELERKKALDDMKQEIVSIASLMAEKVVASSIDMKVQDELIEETLKEMGESTWQS